MPALFGEKDGAVIVKHLPTIISWYRASEVLASAGRYLKSWLV